MNKLLPFLLCLFVLMSGACAAPGQSVQLPEGWQDLTSTEGRFRIALPGVPERTVKDMTVAGAPVKNHRFSVTTEEMLLRLKYSDHPTYDRKLSDDQRRAFYDEMMRRWMLGVLPGAKLTSERDLINEGRPGREWTMEMTADLGMTYRIWIKGDRLYQLTATYNPQKRDAAMQETISRFMDSFQIVENR